MNLKKQYFLLFLTVNHFTLFLSVFVSITGLSQDYQPHLKNITSGIPSLEVYDIYQDANGYMWFSSDRGISRYNGKKFINYTIDDEKQYTSILNIIPQNDTTVWCVGGKTRLYTFNPLAKKNR
ncbi:MAG: hypothetical protein KJ941_04280, partial [Bacteroidetes bacterium]|nr:hypothetical protein [Bacteroidota bacterium]